MNRNLLNVGQGDSAHDGDDQLVGRSAEHPQVIDDDGENVRLDGQYDDVARGEHGGCNRRLLAVSLQK